MYRDPLTGPITKNNQRPCGLEGHDRRRLEQKLHLDEEETGVGDDGYTLEQALSRPSCTVGTRKP